MARQLDENKRIAILEAAKTVFLDAGYADAKISDIASAAGVAAGTLYLYYDSKEALASAIGESFFTRLSTQFGLVVKKLRGPEDIDVFVDWALQIAKQDRDVLCIAKDFQHSSKTRVTSKKLFVDQLADVLQQGMSRGELRHYKDARMLAEIVLAVLRRLFMTYTTSADDSTAALRDAAAEMLKHALFDDKHYSDAKL